MLKILCILILLPFTFICSLFINPKKEYDKNSKFYRKMLHTYTWLVLKLLRVKIDVSGIERIPQNTRFVLVGNHRSNFDPIITWLVFKRYDLAFISKESNFKIPVFGRIIRKCCYMAIDRENPRNAIKTINRAGNLIKSNEVSVAVYPEGTRNKECNGLLPFHNSVFKIAQKANVPIVIVGVAGTESIHKRTPWKRTHVQLQVLDVINAEDVTAMKTNEIGEIVKNTLLASDLIKEN